MIAAVILLSVGNVALHVEEARGVSTATVAMVLEGLAANIEAQSGARVVRHAADWASCTSARRACVEEVLARNRGGEVVALVLVGGITKLRVVMQLFAAGGAVSEFAIDLPKRTGEWGPILRGVAEKMFPRSRVLLAPVGESNSAQVETAPSRLPSWISLGVAAAAGALGVVFRVRSADAQEELAAGLYTQERYRELASRRRFGERASNVCWVVAGVGAASAVTFAVIEF